MENKDGYWVSSHGNKWDDKTFTIQRALDADSTLINCTNCTDCINCTNCTDCINCTNCSNCEGCLNCTHCDRCDNCTDCDFCTECSNCKNCYLCDSCNDCDECDQCDVCSDCRGCRSCHNSQGLTSEDFTDNEGNESLNGVWKAREYEYLKAIQHYQHRAKEAEEELEYLRKAVAELRVLVDTWFPQKP